MATKTRKRIKREPEEGRPYAELSEEAKEKARDWYREGSFDDCECITDHLVEVLGYEFGIEPEYRSSRCHDGKNRDFPEVYWGSYPFSVSFKASIDLEKIAEHGVRGCEYFSESAAAIAATLRDIELVEAAAGGDFECEWHLYFNDGSTDVEMLTHSAPFEAAPLLEKLEFAVRDALESINDDACRRLRNILQDAIEYLDSDEYIVENIEANDYQFDEEGNRV